MLVALFLFARGAGGRATAPATPQPDPVDDGIVRVVQNPAAQAPFPEPEPPSPLQTAGAIGRSYKGYAQSKVGADQWWCLDLLVGAESGWRPDAQNPTSTAYGLFQFLDSTWAGTGYDKSADPTVQVDAGLVYISSRYGTPCAAWDFWKSNGWY